MRRRWLKRLAVAASLGLAAAIVQHSLTTYAPGASAAAHWVSFGLTFVLTATGALLVFEVVRGIVAGGRT